MSTAASPAPAPAADQMSTTEITTYPKKSYRRKYRKIMVKFEERMRESTNLFKDEQRIFDVSQRLAEQTDQILEMLLELNETPQVPRRLRYDLRPPSRMTTTALSYQPLSEESVHEDLRLARDRVQKGEMTTQDYESMQHELLHTAHFAPAKSYTALVRSVKFQPQPRDSPEEVTATPSVGPLTIRQEEQYIQSLDAFLAGKSTNSRAHALTSLGNRNAERTADREREFQQKNPVSVYNWLRKHQPQVFLQDHEAPGEKASKNAGSRAFRKSAGAKDIKQENDLYDTDGIAIDHGVSKGKRKRDDDGAFRPKGGKSGHPTKRRKEDSGIKKSKK